MKKILSLVLVLCMALTAVSALAEARPYEGQKLTLLFMSGTYADTARAIEADFEAATGAEIEIVDFPYATLHEKMLLDFTSGTCSYDVVDVACQWDGEMAPFLEPLDPYIERDGFDIEDFDQNILDNCGRWEGTIYGIPNANTPFCLAYRTDIVPADEVPQTWDEYVETALKYQDVENGLYGIASAASKGQYGGLYYSRIWSQGVDWCDADWNSMMLSDEVRWATEHVGKAMAAIDPAGLNWGVAEATAAFQNGNAVFLETWPTLGICLTGNSDESPIKGKWALMPMPTGYDTDINVLSGWDISINAASQNKELAWEFIKAYTAPETMLLAFNNFSILPPRLSVWEHPDVKNSDMYSSKDYLKGSVIWWRIPASEQARTEINNYLHMYMSGDMDVDEALQLMHEGVQMALEDNPPPEGMQNSTYLTVQNILGK